MTKKKKVATSTTKQLWLSGKSFTNSLTQVKRLRLNLCGTTDKGVTRQDKLGDISHTHKLKSYRDGTMIQNSG